MARRPAFNAGVPEGGALLHFPGAPTALALVRSGNALAVMNGTNTYPLTGVAAVSSRRTVVGLAFGADGVVRWCAAVGGNNAHGSLTLADGPPTATVAGLRWSESFPADLHELQIQPVACTDADLLQERDTLVAKWSVATAPTYAP